MHSSWPWSFGGTSGLRQQQQQQSTEAASGDRPQNSNGSFDFNSFVRSLNRHGGPLPVGFQFNGLTCNGKRSESIDPNAGKSLNELLRILNDSVDRVVGCHPDDHSNTSSFASFRSGVDDKDPAVLNDIIDLVSSTAHELCDITTGKPKSDNSARNVGHHSANASNIRTLVHSKLRARGESPISTLPVADSTPANWEENSRAQSVMQISSVATNAKKRNPRDTDIDATPTGDIFLTYPPELVEIYSENRSTAVKRAHLSAESLETLRHLETPKCFTGEVLRLAKAVGFTAGATPITGDRSRRDWLPATKRINFDDESWPVGTGIASTKDFPPYFTGTPSKVFRCHGAERKSSNANDWSTSSSRSSPIFAGAGEAPADPLDIVVPTRDGEDCSKELVMKKITTGSSGDPIAPLSMRTDGIEISDEDHLYNGLPAKVDKINTVVDEKKNCKIKELKGQPQEIESAIPLIGEEHENETSSDACNLEDHLRDPKTYAKFATKRIRRVCKSKKNTRKKMSSLPKTGDKDTSSTSQSPMTSGRRSRSPLERFGEEPVTIENDNERTGSVKDADDFVVTQMGISSKICRLRMSIGKSPTRQLSAVAKPSEMAIPEKNKLRVTHNIPVEDQELSKIYGSKRVDPFKYPSVCTNQKTRVQNAAQRIWKPGGSIRVGPSRSSSSMPKQSKIAQLTVSGLVRGEQPREYSDSMNRSKASVAICAERSRAPAKNTESMTKAPRSKSKQRPGIPKQVSKLVISKNARPDVKSLDQERRPMSSRELMRKNCSTNDRTIGSGSKCKTAIPVLRSKTFVHQMRREVSSKSSANSVTSGPGNNRPAVREESKDLSVDSRINANSEKSYSHVRFGPDCNHDSFTSDEEFSSNDSIPLTSKAPQIPLKNSALPEAPEDNCTGKNRREKETREQILRSKFTDRHTRSFRMLKDLLAHEGISVDGVNKEARDIRSKILNETAKKSVIQNSKSSTKSLFDKTSTGSPAAAKALFEKLAILTENQPEQSISSFTDLRSESITSYATSMRDAGEQCSIRNVESSVVSQSSIRSEKSQTVEEISKKVMNVGTEMDEVYRSAIYIDAAVESSPRSCEVAETQTPTTAVDKISATEDILPSASKSIVNAFTETENKSLVSREANTEFTGPEINDAASQIDSSEYSTEVASGKDFADTECPSIDVNTDSPDIFLKSRGISARGPQKIDETSQIDRSDNSRDTASGKDYVDAHGISAEVNTDRQDYLFEDRSVDVLGPRTTEEACQVDPPSNIVHAAVGESSPGNEETLMMKVPFDHQRPETVIVKGADVVQWQSSTTFENSRINCSTCSSNSSIMTWRPIARCSQVSLAEKFRCLSERVPKEAITALEIASERAQNLYKAIGIYREHLASRTVHEPIAYFRESVENHSTQINRRNEQGSALSSMKLCNFHKKSKIKSLLEANLEKSCGFVSDTGNLFPVQSLEDCSKLKEEINSIVNDLLADVVENVECEVEDKNFLLEERFIQSKKRRNSCPKVTDVFDEKNNDEELNLSSANVKTLEFSFISRNSLLTFIYGTVCTLVFWALQFSITCDTP